MIDKILVNDTITIDKEKCGNAYTGLNKWFNLYGISTDNYDKVLSQHIEDDNIEFIQRTLLPIINLLEEEINRKLITNTKQYIDIDETELLKGDKKTLAEYYSKLVSSAIITVDEARIALGYNPLNTDYSSSLIIPYTDISQNVLGDKNETNESLTEEKDEV